jgi:hypothetical protein
MMALIYVFISQVFLMMYDVIYVLFLNNIFLNSIRFYPGTVRTTPFFRTSAFFMFISNSDLLCELTWCTVKSLSLPFLQPSGKGATCILRASSCLVKTFKIVKIYIQLEVFACVVLLHWFVLAFIWNLKTSIYRFYCFCFWCHKWYVYLIYPSIYLAFHPSFYLWLPISMALKVIVKSAIQFWGF